jgi:hypothetical protein
MWFPLFLLGGQAMRFVNYESMHKIKQAERQLLILLDRNVKPTSAFIELLAAKVQKLAIEGKIRKDE